MSKLDCKVLEPSLSPHGHIHTHAHILLPLTQILNLTYKERNFRINNQQLCFIAPNQYHHCLCAAEVITINIPDSMIKKSDLEILDSQVILPVEGVLIPLIDLIKTEIKRNPESDSIRYLYYYLYDKLIECNGLKSLRYIREHFSEPITVEMLAQLENYNVSHFTDWFKKKTGQKPSAYLRQVRLEKAKELLQTTHYRMIEIAMQVGYNSNASFCRAFKEAEGISPISYRLQWEKENKS